MADGKKNKRNVLSGQLAQQGFTLPFPIDDILDKAIRSGVEDTYSLAYAMIIKSKRFRNHYRGIFRANGTLKMSPAQYEAYVDTARQQARSAGLSISRRQIGALIARDTSAAELTFRVDAAKEIKANKNTFNAFNQILKANGQQPLKSADDIYDFLNRRQQPRVYDLYERASIKGAADAAGEPISISEARRLANLSAGVTTVEEAQERFQRIAEDLEFAREELRSFGVDPKKLRTAEFGGRNAAQIDQRRGRALRQRQADIETQQVQRGVGLNRAGRPVVAGQTPEAGL